MNGEPPDSPPSSRQASKLNLAGIIILVIGFVISGVVYELGQRAEDPDLDPSMIGFEKQQNAQMERMYGKSGELMEDLTEGLKQPGTQAGIILAISFVTSLICFRFARPIPEEEPEA